MYIDDKGEVDYSGVYDRLSLQGKTNIIGRGLSIGLNEDKFWRDPHQGWKPDNQKNDQSFVKG